MQDHVTSAASDIAQAVNAKVGVASSAINTGVAAGVVVTSTSPEVVESVKFGVYLSTHGIGVISYMEIISVIGSVYLTYKLITEIYDRFISKLSKGNKNGQQTGQ